LAGIADMAERLDMARRRQEGMGLVIRRKDMPAAEAVASAAGFWAASWAVQLDPGDTINFLIAAGRTQATRPTLGRPPILVAVSTPAFPEEAAVISAVEATQVAAAVISAAAVETLVVVAVTLAVEAVVTRAAVVETSKSNA
jgi:hypothetical protein